MKNFGLYTLFSTEENEKISQIIPALVNINADYSVYFDKKALATNLSIPCFQAANLIHFTGTLCVFNFNLFISAARVAYRAKNIIYCYSNLEDKINPLQFFSENTKKAKVMCYNDDCLREAKRLLGDNVPVARIAEDLTNLISG